MLYEEILCLKQKFSVGFLSTIVGSVSSVTCFSTVAHYLDFVTNW